MHAPIAIQVRPRSSLATIRRRDGIRLPLRLQYLIGFALATMIGALWPGFLIGLAMGDLEWSSGSRHTSPRSSFRCPAPSV